MGDFLGAEEINNTFRKTTHMGAVGDGCIVHDIIHFSHIVAHLNQMSVFKITQCVN
jgi:hypothetical protein